MNTLALSVLERQRELGLLRAVGASRRQVRRMVRYESILTAWIGATLGVVLGVFLAWMVIRAVGQGLEFSPPLGSLAVHAAFATVVGVLAAILPARRAARTDVLVALAYEYPVPRGIARRSYWGERRAGRLRVVGDGPCPHGLAQAGRVGRSSPAVSVSYASASRIRTRTRRARISSVSSSRRIAPSTVSTQRPSGRPWPSSPARIASTVSAPPTASSRQLAAASIAASNATTSGCIGSSTSSTDGIPASIQTPTASNGIGGARA